MQVSIPQLVSVIMPVYNCERFVAIAIDSILSQTYKNFELIIIDDCSADKTPQILESYKDDRIIIVRNVRNFGVAESLNLGISISKGELIARMDSDDISLPNRFKKQVEFMQKYPDVGVLGTQCLKINEEGEITDKIKLPEKGKEIFCSFITSFIVAHPSVMIRKKILQNISYNNTIQCAQDYELWSRILFVTRFANLPDVFLHYRVWSQQITTEKRDLQISIAFETLCNFLRTLGVTEPIRKKAEILTIKFTDSPDVNEVNSIFCEFHSLCEKNLGEKFPPPDPVIVRFMHCIIKISKVKFIKNIIFSRYLRTNKCYCKAFAKIFKRIICLKFRVLRGRK